MPHIEPLLPLRRCLLAAASLGALILGLCFLLTPRPLAAGPAPQSGALGVSLTKTLQGSDVVRVGQLLTFTIRIENTGTVSITELPLIDEYNAAVLRLERTDPLSSTSIVTPAAEAGLITWTNLPTDSVGGPLEPGQSFDVTTVFRAIAPREVTVNRARTGTLLGFGGATGAGDEAEDQGSAEGGRVVVAKGLAPGQSPAGGQPITFTIAISNDGAADIVRLPLEDTYSTTHLLFWRAEPPPDSSSSVDPAAITLAWDDILPGLGRSRLRPGEVVTVTTVYTALRSLDGGVVNRARALAVQDEFGNELAAPRQDDVPIRILPGPDEATPTAPTPQPQERPRRERTPTPDATPTAAAVVTATAAITVTAEVTQEAGLAPTATISAAEGLAPGPTPAALPRASGDDGGGAGWILAALTLLVAGAALLAQRSGRRSRR